MRSNKQNNRFAFQDIMKSYGYRLTNYSYMDSFIHNCSFYQTEFMNVLITDYDIIEKRPMYNNMFCAFNFSNGKHLKITLEALIGNKNLVKSVLEKINN